SSRQLTMVPLVATGGAQPAGIAWPCAVCGSNAAIAPTDAVSRNLRCARREPTVSPPFTPGPLPRARVPRPCCTMETPCFRVLFFVVVQRPVPVLGGLGGASQILSPKWAQSGPAEGLATGCRNSCCIAPINRRAGGVHADRSCNVRHYPIRYRQGGSAIYVNVTGSG